MGKRKPIGSDATLKALKAEALPYRHTIAGGKGLCIEVRPTGAKLWRYRYKLKDRQTGKPREYLYAMGEYCKAPVVETPAQGAERRAARQYTLEEARIERQRLRNLVKRGIHPLDERDKAKTIANQDRANTFESVAREWLARQAKKLKANSIDQTTRVLEANAFPQIGNLPIRSVTPAHLLTIITEVEATAPSMAVLLRQRCGAIFRYAMSRLLVDADPTTALKGAIERPAVEHHEPLPQAGIAPFCKKLDGDNTLPAFALRLLLLTFVRPTELRAAHWGEFNLEHALWTIPADRMKGKREHRVPLARQAVAELRMLYKITGEGTYLFPHKKEVGKCMGARTLNGRLERMGYAGEFSAHGFRATASTHLNETNYRSDVIEAQLAHKEKDATRHSYNRAQYLPERKAMMQEWADYIDMLCTGANVTPIRKRAA